MDADQLNHAIGRRIARRRFETGDSLNELAAEAGLSATIVSKIEKGNGNPSLETLFRLARALDVPLSALIDGNEAPRARAIPARSGTGLRADSGMRSWLVHAHARGHHAELYELDLPAGTDQRTAGHVAGTEELVVCLTGRLEVGPVGEEVALGPGDAAWFEADGEHHYLARRASRALNWIATPARA